MISFHLPEGCSLDDVILGEFLTDSERVEMAWQVLRLACEVAGLQPPLNPLASKFDVALAAGIFHFFNDFTEPYERKLEFIRMVRHTVMDYNTAYGNLYSHGLREAKEFADKIFFDGPFTKYSTKSTIASYLRLMNFEEFFKA